MKLAKISPSDPVSKIALEGLHISAPILLDAEFYEKGGAADSVKKARKGAAKAKITRSINEDNIITGPSPVYEAIAKKVVSFDAKVDVVLEDRGEDPFTELALQTKLEAIQAGFKLQGMFFEADSATDGEDFDGMKVITPVAQRVNVATNGLIVPVGNSDANSALQQTAIEELQKLMDMIPGGASHLYMNQFLKARLLTVAKALGYYDKSKDELGNSIDRIGDVIVRGAGYAADKSRLLPQTETTGTSNNCSSIIAVRWGEGIDLTGLTSKGLVGRHTGQSGNFLVNNVNLDMALVLQNAESIIKSAGWRLNA